MKKTIWKHTLKGSTEEMELPEESEILSTIVQNNHIMIYFYTNPECKKKKKVMIYVKGTGHDTADVPDDAIFLGTVSIGGGTLIYHVFYK